MSSSKAKSRTQDAVTALAAIACSVILGAEPALAESGSARASAAAEDEGAKELAVEVIFTGYVRRADKGASIFVRMTGEVPVEADRAGQRLTYRLSGAKLGVRNNANPLPTEYFGPPVSNVALVPSSAGVDLVIDLSAASKEGAPTHRFVTGGRSATLVVELPPASR